MSTKEASTFHLMLSIKDILHTLVSHFLKISLKLRQNDVEITKTNREKYSSIGIATTRHAEQIGHCQMSDSKKASDQEHS